VSERSEPPLVSEHSDDRALKGREDPVLETGNQERR
jgi:hypothetical protein